MISYEIGFKYDVSGKTHFVSSFTSLHGAIKFCERKQKENHDRRFFIYEKREPKMIFGYCFGDPISDGIQKIS